MVTRFYFSRQIMVKNVKMLRTLGNLMVFHNSLWWLLKVGGSTRVAYRYVLSITVDTFIERSLMQFKYHKHLIHTGRHLTGSRRQLFTMKRKTNMILKLQYDDLYHFVLLICFSNRVLCSYCGVKNEIILFFHPLLITYYITKQQGILPY